MDSDDVSESENIRAQRCMMNLDDYKLTFPAAEFSDAGEIDGTNNEAAKSSADLGTNALLSDDYFWDYYETSEDKTPSETLHKNVQFVAVLVPIFLPIDKENWEKLPDVAYDHIYKENIMLNQHQRATDVMHAAAHAAAMDGDHLQQHPPQEIEEPYSECREKSNDEKRGKISKISSALTFSYASDSRLARSELPETPTLINEINGDFGKAKLSHQSSIDESVANGVKKARIATHGDHSNSCSKSSDLIIEKSNTSIITDSEANVGGNSSSSHSSETRPEIMESSYFEYAASPSINRDFDDDTNYALDSIEEYDYLNKASSSSAIGDMREIIPSPHDTLESRTFYRDHHHQQTIMFSHNNAADFLLKESLENQSAFANSRNGVNELLYASADGCSGSEGSKGNIFSVQNGENEKTPTCSTIIVCGVTGKTADQHHNVPNITRYDQTSPSDDESNHTKANEAATKQEMLNVDTCIGGVVTSQQSCDSDENAKFKSLVMISPNLSSNFVVNESSNSSVHLVASELLHGEVTSREFDDDSAIVVQHKNWQPRYSVQETTTSKASTTVKSIIDFYEEKVQSADENGVVVSHGTSSVNSKSSKDDENDEETSMSDVTDANDDGVNKNNTQQQTVIESKHEIAKDSIVSVEYGSDGLADDDSWVENLSQQDSEEVYVESGSDYDSSSEETLMQNSAADREEELRGYNRMSIDFTLHTIVEESCEESEYESNEPQRVSASDLEKYFFFGLGEGAGHPHNSSTKTLKNYEDPEDSHSETSSVCSEGLNSSNENEKFDEIESTLTSSRLEKYFLSGFMGFSADDSNNSNDSGSVGSDSEGKHSPEQRRKKLVRARGSSRSSQSSSLDNLLSKEDSNDAFSHENLAGDSSETDTNSEFAEKIENNSDTIKRKKKPRKSDVAVVDDVKRNTIDTEGSNTAIHHINTTDVTSNEDKKNMQKTDLSSTSSSTTMATTTMLNSNSTSYIYTKKQNSRDSGFVGSNDDLLKSDVKVLESKMELNDIKEDLKETENSANSGSALTRKDSFSAWSSDEETNLMMSKMRQFFKTLVAASTNGVAPTGVETLCHTEGHQTPTHRSPQLIYFENELTRLMKTVPGIRDEHVREIVEYFSSEDTWSDSYDSSDYTSSDKETIIKHSKKIQQQISARCQEIIEKFDASKVVTPDEEGDMGDGGLIDDGLNKETAFVYQKLMASISKIQCEKKTSSSTSAAQNSSPPFIAKVLHHIGSRLEALMHEVSSSDSIKSSSNELAVSDAPKADQSGGERSVNNLGRSKSHDLLLSEGKFTPEVVLSEDRETSDNERFSWRGSFESALLADSSQKLSCFENSSSSALSVLIAKRRSVGDLLFSSSSLSNEQLDRVRSCGSIDGDRKNSADNDGMWKSNHDKTPSDFSKNDDNFRSRSTLPRILQLSINNKSTNSLPRLPISSASSSSSSSTSTVGPMQKAQSVYNFLQNNVKSARYRPPGFNRQLPSKRITKSQTISHQQRDSYKGNLSDRGELYKYD